MTYVLIEKGRVVRPADRDEATRWYWDRMWSYQQRGQHPCGYVGEPVHDCRQRASRCCQGGDLVVRKGWRKEER